jgi:hypothetical protein
MLERKKIDFNKILSDFYDAVNNGTELDFILDNKKDIGEIFKNEKNENDDRKRN